MKKQELYIRAIKCWGVPAQILTALEELTELMLELLWFRREKTNILKIAEEIADSEVMIEQLKVIFDLNSIVRKIKREKLKRLEQKVEKAEKRYFPKKYKSTMKPGDTVTVKYLVPGCFGVNWMTGFNCFWCENVIQSECELKHKEVK